MKIVDIINIIDKAAPEEFAMDWDNSGFLLGDKNSEVKKVLVALDVTSDSVEQAIHEKCNMIIAHHPMFFKGIKSIDYGTPQGNVIKKLIKNDISVYACHTNKDASEQGINARLAEMFSLTEVEVLEKNPNNSEVGIGRVGNLEKEISLTRLCEMTKALLNTPCVRLIKGKADTIKRMAVASGSCSEFIPEAVKLGAEVIITADMKYHDSLDAAELGVSVIDAGHYPTEFLVTDILADLLKDTEIEVVKSHSKDIFLYM